MPVSWRHLSFHKLIFILSQFVTFMCLKRLEMKNNGNTKYTQLRLLYFKRSFVLISDLNYI